MEKAKKKKTWKVVLEVNMLTGKHETYNVKATNSYSAISKAQELCAKDGYFYSDCISCDPIDV